MFSLFGAFEVVLSKCLDLEIVNLFGCGVIVGSHYSLMPRILGCVWFLEEQEKGKEMLKNWLALKEFFLKHFTIFITPSFLRSKMRKNESNGMKDDGYEGLTIKTKNPYFLMENATSHQKLKVNVFSLCNIVTAYVILVLSGMKARAWVIIIDVTFNRFIIAGS